jgi:hypothetical protein
MSSEGFQSMGLLAVASVYIYICKVLFVESRLCKCEVYRNLRRRSVAAVSVLNADSEFYQKTTDCTKNILCLMK